MTHDVPLPSQDIPTQATLLVEEFGAALVNSRIYAVDHPRVQNSIATVHRLVGELAEATGQDAVCIGCVDGLVVFDQRPLLGASIAAARLLTLLEQWGAGGLELRRGGSVDELRELLVGLAARPQPGEGHAALNDRLAVRGCRHGRLLPPYVDAEGRPRSAAGHAEIRVALRFYQSVIDLLQNVTVAVCRGGRIDFAPVQAQAEEVLKRLNAPGGPMLGLARHDQYDAFTFGHSMRVAVLSMNFARTLTDDRELLIRIGTAALLHDVGKSLIPFEILHSSKALTEDERRAMNRHSELGAECLLDHHDSDPLAIAAAFGHHRAPDGSGYPRTGHDHHTGMVTSLVKICDVFEALTAARPYKKPMSPIRAYRVMLAMGDKLDRRLLQRFIAANGVFPVGQFVALDSGEVAVVREQRGDPMRPVVTVVQDAAGSPVAVEEQQLFDLSDVACGCARAILGELAPEAVDARLAARGPAPA